MPIAHWPRTSASPENIKGTWPSVNCHSSGHKSTWGGGRGDSSVMMQCPPPPLLLAGGPVGPGSVGPSLRCRCRSAVKERGSPPVVPCAQLPPSTCSPGAARRHVPVRWRLRCPGPRPPRWAPRPPQRAWGTRPHLPPIYKVPPSPTIAHTRAQPRWWRGLASGARGRSSGHHMTVGDWSIVCVGQARLDCVT